MEEKQLCWWCSHPWDGEILHLPFKYCEKNKQYKTMGNFCSWNCMKAYNMEKFSYDKCGSINSLIIKMIKESTGKMITNIQKAPERYVLKSFGGEYSIEDYRKAHEIGFPIVNYPNQVYKIQNIIKPQRTTFSAPSSHELEGKLKNIENSGNINETLKLKRPKPLKRDLNNLEMSMGIKRISKQN